MRTAPDPQPGPGDIRIRVKATGVNFADVLARMGLYPDAPKLTCVMGCEIAGDVNLGHLWEQGDALKAMLAEIVDLTAAGTFAPVIDRTFPLEQTAEAHRFLQDRKNFGKVLLVP